MSTPTTHSAASSTAAAAAAPPPAVAPAHEMATPSPPPPRRPAQQLLSGHARLPRFDGRSPPPPPPAPLPPHWRVPGAGPFFDPYNGYASNGYGGGGGGGYFSPLNRGPMLPPPPPPPPPHAYALGHRLPPPPPFPPYFGLPAPPPMFDHRHRIPPSGANFAAPFPPLDPFGAPFNPEASGSSNNFPINNLETPPPPVNSEPVQRHVIVIDGKVEIVDHPELLRKLRYQVEYYFCDENFVDDWYLKSIMDSEGWVPMGEIAAFRKVKHLTKNLDVFQLLREALLTSNHVEIQEDKMRKSVVVHDPPNQAIPAPGQ